MKGMDSAALISDRYESICGSVINIWIDLNPKFYSRIILPHSNKSRHNAFSGPIMRVGPITGLVFSEGIAFRALAVALKSSAA